MVKKMRSYEQMETALFKVIDEMLDRYNVNTADIIDGIQNHTEVIIVEIPRKCCKENMKIIDDANKDAKLHLCLKCGNSISIIKEQMDKEEVDNYKEEEE